MPRGECPMGGPRCPEAICDCFIEQFPDDMEQAGGLHPEFFTVVGSPREHIFDGERCTHCGVNVYDSYIYGPEHCAREPITYTTETPEGS